jgi:hypothetical protein
MAGFGSAPTSPLPVVGVDIGPTWASKLNVAIAELQTIVTPKISPSQLTGYIVGGPAPLGSGLDDAPNIQAALSALPSGGTAYGGVIQLQRGLYTIKSKITIPNGCWLRGEGAAATQIKADNTFNQTAMIANAFQDGTQEYAYLSDLSVNGNAGGGAVCSVAAVDWTSLFVNSFVRDVAIVGSSSWGLHVGANAGGGPVLIENVWVLSSGDHNIVVDEAGGNASAVAGITLRQCTSEHQPGGKYALYLHGLGRMANVNVHDLHVEQANGATAGTKAIYIDGVNDVIIDGAQIFSAGSNGGIVIANNGLNARYCFRNITNRNNVTPIIDDQLRTVQFGAVNVPWYTSQEHGVHQDRVQTLTYGATVNTNLTLGNFCQFNVTDGNAFTIANPTNPQQGELLTYEITNASGGAMGAITWGAGFAFRDSSWANPANGKRRCITFRYRGANWGQVAPATGDM